MMHFIPSSTEVFHSTEAELRAVFEQSPLGIGRLRLSDGQWLDANLALCNMVGLSRDSMQAASLSDILHPDDVERGVDLFKKAVEQQLASSTLEARLLHSGRDDVWARLSLHLIRNAEGQSEYIAAMVEDISDLKKSRLEQIASSAQLEAERSRLQAIVDTIPTGLIMLDESGELVIENAEWIRTWAGSGRVNGVIDYTKYKGFYPDTGAPLPPEDWPCALSLKKGIKTRDVILDIERFNGTRGTIVVSSAPVLDANGRVVAAVAANMDISELRAAERKLSAEDKRKNEFIATLAHELRNPLAPIRSGLAILALSGDGPEAFAKVRHMMERQVTHMVRLIDDLLDIARISGDKLSLQKEPIDLRSVVASAIENNVALIEAKRQTLHVNVPDQVVEADVDGARVVQIISNLLNNSTKYTPHEGSIEVSLHRNNNDAVIVVTDTGIGIAAKELGGVFEMFSQVESESERLRDGLGIGLSLVRRLADMHGGTVEARSTGLGDGSTFTVRLPIGAIQVDPTKRSELNVSDNLPTPIAPLKVLVVDDNVDAAETLAMILELQNHEVRIAHDGIDALARVAQFTPDIVLLDIGMPRMNGFETAQEMRKLKQLDSARIVALTGWGTKEDRDRSIAAGFNSHLTKPVNIQELEQIINEVREQFAELLVQRCR